MMNIVVPLAIYPFVIKRLGSEKYGLVLYSQAIIAYLVLFVNFGFNISGTKYISKFRDSIKRKSQIVSVIYIIKFAFLILSFTILVILFSLFDSIREEFMLYLLTFHLCFYETFFPVWFFQGIEKMKIITFASFLGKLIYVPLILIVIREPDDYLYLPLINGIVTIAVVTYSNIVMYKQESIRLFIVDFRIIKIVFIETIDYFLSNCFVLLKERTNIFVIGTFLSMSDVALYDFVMKVVNVLRMPFMMFRDAIFPSFVKKNSMKRYQMVIFVISIIAFLIYLLGVIVFPYIENIVGGEELVGASYYYNRLGLFIPFGVFAMYLGTGLILKEKRKEYRKSITYSVVIYFFGLLFLYLISGISNMVYLIYVFLLSLIVELIYRIKVYKWD